VYRVNSRKYRGCSICYNESHRRSKHKRIIAQGKTPQPYVSKRTACPRGHPYDIRGTYKNGQKFRWCSICKIIGSAAWSANLKAKKAGAVGVTHEQLHGLPHEHCYFCERALDFRAEWLADNKPTIEHLVPPSRGGSYSIENLAWACWGCNRRKGDMTELEFMGARRASTGLIPGTLLTVT
jgi:5-methylcytosine-specific restriction endonuclease McrA